MSKKALVLLADGTEEMEFTIPVDILRRAEVQVTVVGVQLKEHSFATGRSGIKLIPDAELEHEGLGWKAEDFDALVVPGGMVGALTFRDNVQVQKLVSAFYEQSKIVAFICAATLVAKAAGIPRKHKVTSHPSVKDQLKDTYEYLEDRIVVDQNVVTSRGPGTAFLFALTLVELLTGKEMVEKLKGDMLTASTL